MMYSRSTELGSSLKFWCWLVKVCLAASWTACPTYGTLLNLHYSSHQTLYMKNKSEYSRGGCTGTLYDCRITSNPLYLCSLQIKVSISLTSVIISVPLNDFLMIYVHGLLSLFGPPLLAALHSFVPFREYAALCLLCPVNSLVTENIRNRYIMLKGSEYNDFV